MLSRMEPGGISLNAGKGGSGGGFAGGGGTTSSSMWGEMMAELVVVAVGIWQLRSKMEGMAVVPVNVRWVVMAVFADVVVNGILSILTHQER